MSGLIHLLAGICMGAGAIVIIVGAFYLTAGMAHCIRWKWGDALEIKRAVKLGWNAGEPPDGAYVLVRNNLRDRPILERLGTRDTGQWAVMQRRGDMLWSQTGGYGMPVKNVTGWLEIVEGDDAQG